MGDLSKALGGYTETPFGWVNDSDYTERSHHICNKPSLDDIAWGEQASVLLPCADIMPSITWGKYIITQDSRNRSRYYLFKPNRLHVAIPNQERLIAQVRNDAGEFCFCVKRELLGVLDDLLNKPLEKGLFTGVSRAQVLEFLETLPNSIRPHLEIGSDFIGEDYPAHIAQLSKIKLDRNVYVSDIVAIMVYKDPMGALACGAADIVAQARAIKASLS